MDLAAISRSVGTPEYEQNCRVSGSKRLRRAFANGAQLNAVKISQNADDRQTMLAWIWLVSRILWERQNMSKIAVSTAVSAFGALLRMALRSI